MNEVDLALFLICIKEFFQGNGGLSANSKMHNPGILQKDHDAFTKLVEPAAVMQFMSISCMDVFSG